jgi:tetratricopeptide (TPR) repeat protein
MSRVQGILSLLFVPAWLTLAQQSTPDINKYLARIESGEANQVRKELPSLLAAHPENPGVLYLQAVLTTDGAEAVRMYQSVVDNHPRSEWADDALYKVYQFYYAIGLYRTAEMKLSQLKKEYPQSRYVLSASEPPTAALTEETTVVPDEPLSQPEEPTSIARSAQGQFALQVGAYGVQVNAEKQKLFFEDLGYPVDVVSRVRDGRALFLVFVGSYATYDEAKAKGAVIKATYNIESIVVTR